MAHVSTGKNSNSLTHPPTGRETSYGASSESCEADDLNSTVGQRLSCRPPPLLTERAAFLAVLPHRGD